MHVCGDILLNAMSVITTKSWSHTAPSETAVSGEQNIFFLFYLINKEENETQCMINYNGKSCLDYLIRRLVDSKIKERCVFYLYIFITDTNID